MEASGDAGHCLAVSRVVVVVAQAMLKLAHCELDISRTHSRKCSLNSALSPPNLAY